MTKALWLGADLPCQLHLKLRSLCIQDRKSRSFHQQWLNLHYFILFLKHVFLSKSLIKALYGQDSVSLDYHSKHWEIPSILHLLHSRFTWNPFNSVVFNSSRFLSNQTPYSNLYINTAASSPRACSTIRVTKTGFILMDINQLPSHQCQVKESLCSQALMPGSSHLPCLLAHLQHSTSSLETP